MKNIKLIAITASFLSLFSLSAAAELIFGIKAGVVDADVSNALVTKQGTTTTLQLGYEFLDLALVDIAVEGEIGKSGTDIQINADKYSLDSEALYLSLRTAGPVYVIGRAGIAGLEAQSNRVGAKPIKDTGKSLGVGVGFSVGLRWELEYTTYELNDEDWNAITLGVAF